MPSHVCGADHWSRRTLLQAGGAAALSWLTPLGTLLARDAEKDPKGAPARSVIVLWLAGGPSQLETFDPHPGTMIAGGTQAIDSRMPGIQLAKGMEHLAEQMDAVSLVRSVVSKEGDHERAAYHVKTGFRPDPTLVHPSIGAVLCHELPEIGMKSALTFPSCLISGRRAVISATSTTPSKFMTRRGLQPDITPTSRRSTNPTTVGSECG